MKRWLLVLTALAASASCMKKPDLTQEDGEPVGSQALAESITRIWGDPSLDQVASGSSFHSVAEGDFVYTEKTQEVSSLPKKVILQDGKTVLPVDEDATFKRLRIAQQNRDFSTEENPPDVSFEFGLDYNKVLRKLSFEPSSNGGVPLGIVTMLSMRYACTPPPDGKWKVECFNLQTWEEEEAAPPLIAAQAGCGGLPDCRWRKKVMSFVRATEYVDPDTNTQVRAKIIYTMKTSPDAPFLARLTDFCFRGLATVGNQKIPVTICESVRNFRRGGH